MNLYHRRRREEAFGNWEIPLAAIYETGERTSTHTLPPLLSSPLLSSPNPQFLDSGSRSPQFFDLNEFKSNPGNQ